MQCDEVGKITAVTQTGRKLQMLRHGPIRGNLKRKHADTIEVSCVHKVMIAAKVTAASLAARGNHQCNDADECYSRTSHWP